MRTSSFCPAVFISSITAAVLLSGPAIAATVKPLETTVAWQGESISVSEMNAKANSAMVVGAPSSSDGAGAALFFLRNNKGKWNQVAKFADSPQKYSNFGQSVSISLDGTVALVGVPNDGASAETPYRGPGAAFLYKYKNGSWKKVTVLRGTDVIGDAQRGKSVWVSPDGSTAFVGGFEDNDSLGAVWVFDLTGPSPRQQAKLIPNDAAGAARFGHAISSSKTGDRVVIGGPDDADALGASWIFERKNGKWSQAGSKIVGTDGIGGYQWQGYSVSMNWSGESFITGAPMDNNYTGSAFVFDRKSADRWTQKVRLTDPASSDYGSFGKSVAMSGGNGSNVVVGEPYAEVAESHYGRVLNFAKSGSTADYVLKATVETTGCEEMGRSVAISASSDFLFAGAPKTRTNGVGTGATCFYVKDTSSKQLWTLSGNPIYGK